jgi:hypothetical protein
VLSTTASVPVCVAAAYEALRTKDLRLLLQALDPGFVLSASAGMPLGVGGVRQITDTASWGTP